MDPLATTASALTILAIVIPVIRWAWKRRKKPDEPASLPEPSASPAMPSRPSTEQKRAGTRLANNAASILDDLRYLAEQTKSPADFEERKASVGRWLREFTEDVKPHLHDLADLDGEERARRVYGDLNASLVPLLNTRSAWIMTADDDEPVPGWAEQYKPIKDGLPEHIATVEQVLRWAQEQAGLTPDGQWTRAEEKAIRDAYFRDRTAVCPRDGAQLKVMQDMTTRESRLAMVFCPNCQRKADGI
jgi:hypothetical protein